MQENKMELMTAIAMSQNNSPNRPFRKKKGMNTIIVVREEPIEETETDEVACTTISL